MGPVTPASPPDRVEASPPRRRGGRPPLADRAAVRTRTVGVRVSAAELVELRARAAGAGVDVATWLRLAGLRRRPPPPPVPAINREVYAVLGRIGGLLNQVAAEAHRGRVIAPAALLEELRAQVAAVRLELLGAVECQPFPPAPAVGGRVSADVPTDREAGASAAEASA